MENKSSKRVNILSKSKAFLVPVSSFAVLFSQCRKIVLPRVPFVNCRQFMNLVIRFTSSAFRKLPSIYVFSYFPFGLRAGCGI